MTTQTRERLDSVLMIASLAVILATVVNVWALLRNIVVTTF